MKTIIDSIDLRFEKLHWIFRTLLYIATFVVVLVLFEIVTYNIRIESFLLVQLLSFIFMSTSAFIVVALYEKSNILKRFGFEKGNILKKYSLGYLIGLVLIVTSSIPVMLFFSKDISLSSPVPYFGVLGYFGFFIIQGASEEVFLRGMVFPMIAKKSNILVSMLVTSGAFAALHLTNSGVSVLGIVNIFLAGVLFSYCVVYFDSLWQACALHSAWNFIQGNILGFKVSGITTPSIMNVTTEGKDIFTGGAFGVEGSIFSVIVLTIAIIMFHIGCKKKGISLI